MKKVLILLFAVSILFQSCYSYKSINKNNDLEIGEIYKIKQDNYFEKVKLLAINDSVLTFKDGRDEVEIPKSKILEIKERDFSVGKTVLGIIGIGLITVATIIAVALSNSLKSLQK